MNTIKKVAIGLSLALGIGLAGGLAYTGATGLLFNQPQIEQGNADIQTPDTEKDELLKQIDNLKAQIEEYKTQQSQNESKIASLQSELEAKEQELAEKTKECEETMAELTTQLDDAGQRNSLLEKQITDLEKQIGDLEKQITGLENEKEQLTESANSLEETIKNLEAQIEELQAKPYIDIEIDYKALGISAREDVYMQPAGNGVLLSTSNDSLGMWFIEKNSTKKIQETGKWRYFFPVEGGVLIGGTTLGGAGRQTLFFDIQSKEAEVLSSEFNEMITSDDEYIKINDGYLIFSTSRVLHFNEKDRTLSTILKTARPHFVGFGDEGCFLSSVGNEGLWLFDYTSQECNKIYEEGEFYYDFSEVKDGYLLPVHYGIKNIIFYNKTTKEIKKLFSDEEFADYNVYDWTVQSVKGGCLISTQCYEKPGIWFFNENTGATTQLYTGSAHVWRNYHPVEEGCFISDSHENSGPLFFDNATQTISRIYEYGSDWINIYKVQNGYLLWGDKTTRVLFFDIETKEATELSIYGSSEDFVAVYELSTNNYLLYDCWDGYLYTFDSTSHSLSQIGKHSSARQVMFQEIGDGDVLISFNYETFSEILVYNTRSSIMNNLIKDSELNEIEKTDGGVLVKFHSKTYLVHERYEGSHEYQAELKSVTVFK